MTSRTARLLAADVPVIARVHFEVEADRYGPDNPGGLVVVSGATAALDILASTLCDPGEAIVVPVPYYAAFDTDLTGRSGARLVPAVARLIRVLETV